MPLSEHIKPSFVKQKIGRTFKKIGEETAKHPLEIILVLLILVNIFISMKLILALFIVLFFLDRWDIINQLITYKNYGNNIQETRVDNDPPHSSEL